MIPTFLWYIVGSILLLSILAYLLQEKFIFRPEILKADFAFKYEIPFREYFFDSAPGVRINGLHFYRDNPKGLILYFHGIFYKTYQKTENLLIYYLINLYVLNNIPFYFYRFYHLIYFSLVKVGVHR